jgi:hypothetical protein
MFDKASLKLGLDKALLQSMNTTQGKDHNNKQLSKKEIEDLLKKGYYNSFSNIFITARCIRVVVRNIFCCAVCDETKLFQYFEDFAEVFGMFLMNQNDCP